MVIEHRKMCWNIIPWICSFQFIERSQTFLSNVPAFIAQTLKKTTEVFFWTTLFSSKCSLELIGWSFVIPADFVCRKSKLFFALNPKFLKKTLLCSKDFFLSKRSSALKESYFDKPSKKSLPRKSEIDKTGHRTSGNMIKSDPWDM